ncbi:MAG: regulator of sigma E protease [Planctomycetota bacterium]|jgi:regulator of sigma E protease
MKSQLLRTEHTYMEILDLFRIVQVVLGIGLVIFVHESGHFIAARLCKVRVYVFSLGFGPKLFSWKKGHTEYQIAAVPLGGFVRMAGEESSYSDEPAKGWELGSKSVGARFFIYSAGVIMNVIFGLVVFPILFYVGIPSTPPIVGAVAPGSAAWMAGLQPGTKILDVNGESIYDLDQVAPEVAFGGTENVALRIIPPGESQPVVMNMAPTFDDFFGIYSIGRMAPELEEGLPLTVIAESPAARAGLQSGDLLLGVVDQTPGLTPAKQLASAVEAEAPFTVNVNRAGKELAFHVTPEAGELEGGELIGFTTTFQHLVALRETELVRKSQLAKDDRILKIEGHELLKPGDLLVALVATEGLVEYEVRREGKLMSWEAPALTQEQGIQLAGDLALTYDQDSTSIVVFPGSAAERAGLVTGDLVLEVNSTPVQVYQDLVNASRSAASSDSALVFSVRRETEFAGNPDFFDIEARPEQMRAMSVGLNLSLASYTYRVTSLPEALKLGVTSSFKMIRDVWRSLRGMMRREVGKQNVGSIIKISIIAHHTATLGWVKFFWFLCVLSMNLAFLNVLPIPILDGGHLFFLLVEKLKGSPVSERIFSYSQLVGLVLIVSIFVFVIYNDLSTHVFN